MGQLQSALSAIGEPLPQQQQAGLGQILGASLLSAFGQPGAAQNIQRSQLTANNRSQILKQREAQLRGVLSILDQQTDLQKLARLEANDRQKQENFERRQTDRELRTSIQETNAALKNLPKNQKEFEDQILKKSSFALKVERAAKLGDKQAKEILPIVQQTLIDIEMSSVSEEEKQFARSHLEVLIDLNEEGGRGVETLTVNPGEGLRATTGANQLEALQRTTGAVGPELLQGFDSDQALRLLIGQEDLAPDLTGRTVSTNIFDQPQTTADLNQQLIDRDLPLTRQRDTTTVSQKFVPSQFESTTAKQGALTGPEHFTGGVESESGAIDALFNPPNITDFKGIGPLLNPLSILSIPQRLSPFIADIFQDRKNIFLEGRGELPETQKLILQKILRDALQSIPPDQRATGRPGANFR